MLLSLRRMHSQTDVVRRATALRALVLVAAGEEQPPGQPRFSPREQELLARGPAQWDEQERVDALWHGEALGMLAWAVSLVGVAPPYDQPFDHVGIARAFDVQQARLRPAEELEQARASAQLWHWRARTAQLQEQRSVELPEPWRSYDQLVAATAMRGYEEELLPAPLRGDFPAFGTVYRNLDREQRALMLSIASERHYALNWLCSGSAWDETTTDT